MRSRALLFTLILLLAACRPGPKYHVPPVPQTPAAFKELKETDQWKFARPSDGELRGNWWELFNDPRLNELEAHVSVSNQTLKQAEAQFRQARALLQGNRAGYFPSVTASPGITASHSGNGRGVITGGGVATSSSASRISTFYSFPLGVSWEPDLWGRVRLTVENATAGAQATAADLENTRLSLQAELAVDYFQLRGTDMTIALLTRTLEIYRQSLELTRNRFSAGVASRSDVVQAQTQVDSTQAALTDTRISRAQSEHAIATLIGRAPAGLTIAPAAIHGTPPLVPVGLPSRLLERRPDVAANERQVAAANAGIGLAEVAYFPSLQLSAAGGFDSSSITKWFSLPGRFWSMGPSLSQTLVDFGRRHAVVQESEAAYDATVAAYRQSALGAFQEVEDSLAALRYLEQEAAEQSAATRSAEESLRLETDRYKAGTASFLDVIQTQVIALTSQRADVGILARRMTSTVNLIRALGGGWNARSLPSPDTLRQPLPKNWKPAQ
ncbi:MAG: efflux transporter outer membrane subunit [Bryobacterales bacterium]|nr:efflux transporter outer membrane subunit [Bryobacterales bacterium]